MILVWLRNDLRLADNPALWHAFESGKPFLCVYCHCDEQDKNHMESTKKISFKKAHVKHLFKRLTSKKINCIELDSGNYTQVAHLLRKFWKENKIDQLFFNKSYLLNEQERDMSVTVMAEADGLRIRTFDANYLMPLGAVRKADHSSYQVFTPFKKSFLNSMIADYQPPYPVHPGYGQSLPHNQIQVESFCGWPIGEHAALSRLKYFTSNADYEKFRDRPDIDGTSQLSPYLSIGVISAKQCLAYWLKTLGPEAFESKWVSELIWREYYADLCFEYPKLVKGEAFKIKSMDSWQNNMPYFEAWKKGETGYPIIDAGMKQLLSTGWMHNRVRMLVASFLTKLCLVDWRMGERFFMQQLIDGDFASNNGGWQWSSATGCDASPYFRIFNPLTQSQNFDPEGKYIKTYLPELNSLSNKNVHNPNSSQRVVCGYPEPILNYKEQRLACMSWFKSKIN